MPAHTVDPLRPAVPLRPGIPLRPAVPLRPAIPGHATGCWRLAPGRALSLRPCAAGVLEIARGRVWLTLRGAPGQLPDDHVLHAGERLRIGPGQHAVLEAWHPPGATDAVAFHWDGVAGMGAPAPGERADSHAAMDWECGVLQPLRELAQALDQGGRAAGRLLAGIARWAWQRSAWRRQAAAGFFSAT